MSERKKLIRAIENAITELQIRREDPTTSQPERADIDARLAELEGQLAQLRAQELEKAALDTAVQPPDDDTVTKMRKLTRQLDDSVAEGKQASAVINLIDKAFAVLTT